MMSHRHKEASFVLETGAAQLVLSAVDGRLESLMFGDCRWTEPAPGLFRLGVRNEQRDLEIWDASQFQFSGKGEVKELVFRFDALPEAPALSVEIHIQARSGKFYFRPRIQNMPERFALEWFELPQARLRDTQCRVFLSQFEGVIVDDPLHYNGFAEANFPYYNFYPGATQMQFMAALSPCGDGGVYFGAHDPQHGTKAFEPRIVEGKIEMSIRVFCGDARNFAGDYEMVMAPFAGDWMDACDCYRAWLETSGMLPPKGRFPQLVDASPIILIYPVCGTGDDKGDMTTNEYFPYMRALPAVRKLAQELDSKVMALLMHWEGTAPWAPPYVWPPLGGEEILREYGEALHRDGNFLGVYCSGTAWTQRSSITDYSCEARFAAEHLDRYMIQGPHGEMEAYICNGPKGKSQRIGCDMCISEEWAHNTVCEEVEKIAAFGEIDYAQFFDQNLGGASHMCWAEQHHHPALPGAWQSANMLALQRELREKHPDLVLGCEAAAADCYLGNLQFSDLRYAAWAFAKARPVPAYAYLFHEYLNNFMGNQCGLTTQLFLRESPENQLWRTAYAFNCGNLLSLTLKDGGEPQWGWSVPWEYPGPEREPIVTLLRNLNTVRRAYPEFLQYGRMLRDEVSIACGKIVLKTTSGDRELPSVTYSTWRAADGRKALIVTNFLPHAQTVQLTYGVGNGSTAAAGTETLDLPPLSAQVCGGL